MGKNSCRCRVVFRSSLLFLPFLSFSHIAVFWGSISASLISRNPRKGCRKKMGRKENIMWAWVSLQRGREGGREGGREREREGERERARERERVAELWLNYNISCKYSVVCRWSGALSNSTRFIEVGFTERERLLGDSALSQIKQLT